MHKHHYKKLSEQIIVITGASSGIGLCTAEQAAAKGAKLVLVSRNEQALKEICDRLNAEEEISTYVVADVGKEEEVQRIADAAIERFGRFDTWINNAGVLAYSELGDLPTGDHKRIFQTNYWGTVYGSQVAQAHFKQHQDGGVIINIASINAQMPVPILGAYSASKAAVKAYSDVLRMELSHEKAPIAVTVVMPSGVSTPISEHAPSYTGDEGKVMPPLYDPTLVAEAILTAAQKNIRDVTVGEAGKLGIMAWTMLPSVMGKFVGWMLPKAQSTGEEPTQNNNLYSPGKDGQVYLDGKPHGISNSLSTKARLNPGVSLGIGVLAVTACGAYKLRQHDARKLKSQFRKRLK